MKKIAGICLCVMVSLSAPVSSQTTPPMGIDDLTGFAAPDFSLPDTKNNTVSLRDFRGKVVFLNFWATWCPPCREEIPHLNRLGQKYRGKNFQLISISTDLSRDVLNTFLKKNALEYLVLHDPESAVARKYRAYALPAAFLIDRSGKIVERFYGAEEWGDEKIYRKIDRLL